MKQKIKKAVSVFVTLLLLLLLPVQAFAQEYDLANGTVSVTARNNEQYVSQGSSIDEKQTSETVITGSSNPNTITIEAEAGQTANVTLKDVNIDCSGIYGSAALITSGDGDVNIELDGNNMLASGTDCAGLNKENTGSLTISDDDNNGSLEATGGRSGAGIGGGYSGDGNNITITGGTVTANGGSFGAGIGGGQNGDGNNITITGGTVMANGGNIAAGIGGGQNGDGNNITITGGEVTANGGNTGAGIGGGRYGDGSNIEISGGTVTANGGLAGAGIGGGYSDYNAPGGEGSNITISGGTVTANGGNTGAGIGGGYYGDGSNINITGGLVTGTGGDGGAAIGGGQSGDGNDIIINSGMVTAIGGDCGAGIGGGSQGNGSNVTVSGNSQVRVQGGKSYGYNGTGAGIGNGGYNDGNGNPINGEEIVPDTLELLADGWIKYYAPGENMNGNEPEPKPYNAPAADSAYKIGDKVVLNGIEWIIVGIDGDFVELASVNAFSEEQLKDLEALIKTLLTEAQLGKLAADKATGERVFLADENIANEYFGGEKGHIMICANMNILDDCSDSYY